MVNRFRKPHPADARDAEVIANATRFDLALFLGTGRYARASAATLNEAAQAAARLTLEHRNGRMPMIYAIDAAGRAALVTSQLPSEDMMQKTYTKKFNAQRAAKAAGHDPDKIEIVKAKGGFAFRVKEKQPAVQIADLAASGNPTAKANTESGNAIPAIKCAPEKTQEAEMPKATGKWTRGVATREAAQRGELPVIPDFSAETHKRFRNKHTQVAALVEADDIVGLKAFEINPVSSSPKAIARYRDLCIIALEARQQAA